MQHIWIHCTALNALHYISLNWVHCTTMDCIECNALNCSALGTLHYIVVHWAHLDTSKYIKCIAVHCSALQYIALARGGGWQRLWLHYLLIWCAFNTILFSLCYNALNCTTLQCIALYCSALSALHYIALARGGGWQRLWLMICRRRRLPGKFPPPLYIASSNDLMWNLKLKIQNIL